MVPVPLTTLGAWHLWRVGTVDPPLAFLRPKLPPPVDRDLHLSFASGARWLRGLLASTSATGLGGPQLSELVLESLELPLEDSVSLDLRPLPFLLLWPAFFAFLRSLRLRFFSFLCFFFHSSFK